MYIHNPRTGYFIRSLIKSVNHSAWHLQVWLCFSACRRRKAKQFLCDSVYPCLLWCFMYPPQYILTRNIHKATCRAFNSSLCHWRRNIRKIIVIHAYMPLVFVIKDHKHGLCGKNNERNSLFKITKRFYGHPYMHTRTLALTPRFEHTYEKLE